MKAKETSTAPEIYKLLAFGEENAVTAAELADLLGVPTRAITRKVRAERLDGYPIATSAKGFFLPRDRAEAATIARRLHLRAAAIHATATAIERAVCDPPEQTMIAEG